MTAPGDADTSSELQELLRQWRAVMAAARPSWAGADLTITQLRALSTIRRREALRVGELAGELGIGLAAASSLADRMARHGLIVRGALAADRRIVLLETAPKGRALLERLERGRTEHFAGLIARMTPRERQALATTLRAFIRIGAERDARRSS